MLDKKYYVIITKIMNETMSRQRFNYKMVMDISYYIYQNYVKKSNLEKFMSYLKKWGFVEYNQGGKYPFTLKMQIPLSIVEELCYNKYYTNEQRAEILKQHCVVLFRRDKVLKLKGKMK
jgi:hypothetical protein